MNDHPRHVYAIGIAGVGVSAIARYYLVRGSKVSGSDPRPSPLIDDLRSLGADIVAIPDPARLVDVDLVVFSDDVPPDQPERLAATAKNIPSLPFATALGQIMSHHAQRIAVAGTNGKSTTTAMLGLLLAAAQQDPTVFVGSRVNEFKGNLRLGTGPLFVAEADEYRDHFLQLDPTAAIITNVELDHVEYFQTVERMEKSYLTFLDRLGSAGPVVLNADDAASVRLWAGRPGVTTFGFADAADVRITAHHVHEECQQFRLVHRGGETGVIKLHIPGTMNVMNAVGAMTMAAQLGVAWDDMIPTIGAFHGIWRRFEVLRPKAKTLVVNDYAHHPTSVKATVDGARAFYPSRRIIAVFQPHHRHRLAALFTDFAAAFDAAHQVIITDVYAVPGREVEETDAPTSKDLAAAISTRNAATTYAPSLTDVVNAVTSVVKPGDVVLLMGAGDIWTIGDSLASAYE